MDLPTPPRKSSPPTIAALKRQLGTGAAKKGVDIVPPKVVVDEDASEADIIRWVFQNMGRQDVDVHKALCPGAFYLWEQVHKDPITRRFFYTSVWSKLLSSKNLEDQSRELQKDATRIISIIEDLEIISEECRN